MIKRWCRPIAAAAAAFLGIQSNANRARDFSSNSPWPYVIAGVLLAVVFVGTLVTIVSIIV